MLRSDTPWIPVPAQKANAFAFEMTHTGETLEFDNSWLTNLDRVEQILWDNYSGNYIEYRP